MNAEHCRQLARATRHVSVGRHPDVRQSLEDDLLDAVTVALEHAELARVERRGGARKASPGDEQALADRVALPLPVVEGGRRPVRGSQFGGARLDEVEEGVVRGAGGPRQAHCDDENPECESCHGVSRGMRL